MPSSAASQPESGSSAAVSETPDPVEEEPQILVAYFSYTGNTEDVAVQIADLTGGTIFSLLLTTDKNPKCQTPGQKNFPLTYYYNPNRAKWPETEPGNKKSSKSFSDLLLSLAAGGGWYSVLKVRVRLVR